jgi:hypothetical protein
MQVLDWCTDSWADMAEHVGQYDDEAEYKLSPGDAHVLRAFLMGTAVYPILTSLDTDPSRVAARKKKGEDVSDFQSLRRDQGLHELCRWLDDTKVYDRDDFEDTKNAKTPLKYSAWLDLLNDIAAGEEEEGQLKATYSKALASILAYVHNLHFKLDYVLANIKLAGHSGSAYADDDLKARHPFLHNCDDHVAKVPNSVPIMLARTSAVYPFPHVVLCSLLVLPVSFFLVQSNAPTYDSQEISYEYLTCVTMFLRILSFFSYFSTIFLR